MQPDKWAKYLIRLKEAALKRPVKYDLEYIEEAYSYLGMPGKDLKFVHVTGTNGKGTCVTKLSKGIEKAGFRTGVFTSPHLCTIRERVAINGDMISKEECYNFSDKIDSILPKDLRERLGFFDFQTLMALDHFSRHKVDYAVMEVGLGGMFDSTNIIKNTKLAVITNISLDHTEVLGNTLSSILDHKKGIIKPGCDVLIGPSVNLTTVQLYADQVKARSVTQIKPALGFIDEMNCLATAGLRALSAAEPRLAPTKLLADAVCSAMPKGRLERLRAGRLTVVLDVGHNPDAMARIGSSLGPGPWLALFAGQASKDAAGCLAALAGLPGVAEVWATRLASESAASALARLSPHCTTASQPTVASPAPIVLAAEDDLASHLATLLASERPPFTSILVCGSFLNAAAVYALSGVDCDADSVDMNSTYKFK